MLAVTNTCVASLHRLHLVRESLSERSEMCAGVRGERPLAATFCYCERGADESSLARAEGSGVVATPLLPSTPHSNPHAGLAPP
eukprot:1463662-Pleurochrysis_carterae.AAC.1